MTSFSQRYGYTSAESAFQRESIDLALRTRIWNVLSVALWNHYGHGSITSSGASYDTVLSIVARDLCVDHLNIDSDSIKYFSTARDVIKKQLFIGEWYSVYDLLEFLCQHSRVSRIDPGLADKLNGALQSHNAAYRIVQNNVVEITDKNEIAAIEDALSVQDAATNTHIATALRMLSDRENPDYRNSVKESISAVEAACRQVTKNPKATLSDALRKIKGIHPAFNKSMALLYGYAGDESGIRHALSGEDLISYADAKYMLVACSAFVSYLLQSVSDEE